MGARAAAPSLSPSGSGGVTTRARGSFGGAAVLLTGSSGSFARALGIFATGLGAGCGRAGTGSASGATPAFLACLAMISRRCPSFGHSHATPERSKRVTDAGATEGQTGAEDPAQRNLRRQQDGQRQQRQQDNHPPARFKYLRAVNAATDSPMEPPARNARPPSSTLPNAICNRPARQANSTTDPMVFV